MHVSWGSHVGAGLLSYRRLDGSHQETQGVIMRDTLIRGGVASFSGLFAVSFLAFVPGTAAMAADAAYVKRDESVMLLATVDEDDDEREKLTPFSVSRVSAPSRASAPSRVSRVSRHSMDATASKMSRNTRDKTNSRFSAVSRDRDKSRFDLTRDWTMDGGDPTRDRTKDSTNDNSRNDTRWGR